MRVWLRGLGLAIALFLIVAITLSIARQHRLEKSFEQWKIGTFEAVVVTQLGKPWKIVKCGELFGGDVHEHCAKEYLYASPYAPLKPEYWALRFDENGRMIEKYHYVSQ
jgi:hypothetical protein